MVHAYWTARGAGPGDNGCGVAERRGPQCHQEAGAAGDHGEQHIPDGGWQRDQRSDGGHGGSRDGGSAEQPSVGRETVHGGQRAACAGRLLVGHGRRGVGADVQ